MSMDSRDRRRRMMTLIKRTGDACSWCGFAVRLDVDQRHARRATVDHLTPRHLGGVNAMTNLAVACAACNETRGDMPVALWREWLDTDGRAWAALAPEERPRVRRDDVPKAMAS